MGTFAREARMCLVNVFTKHYIASLPVAPFSIDHQFVGDSTKFQDQITFGIMMVNMVGDS